MMNQCDDPGGLRKGKRADHAGACDASGFGSPVVEGTPAAFVNKSATSAVFLSLFPLETLKRIILIVLYISIVISMKIYNSYKCIIESGLQ